MGPAPSWNLTGSAFERLLSRLDSDREAAGRGYEKLRRKLADYFESHGSTCPDAQADEVLDRVARKLEQGETIESMGSYALGVARLVSLEWGKRRAGEREAVAALSATLDEAPGSDVEQLATGLEACLKELPERSRALVLAYYQEEEGSRGWTASRVPEGRRRLAQEWGLSYTNLKVRVHRLKERLEECLRSQPWPARNR